MPRGVTISDSCRTIHQPSQCNMCCWGNISRANFLRRKEVVPMDSICVFQLPRSWGRRMWKAHKTFRACLTKIEHTAVLACNSKIASCFRSPVSNGVPPRPISFVAEEKVQLLTHAITNSMEKSI
eukprot:6180110-Pleurochrysis_carterae.AAC.1